jgi:transcriptional regulator with XRE-family HTH domain
MNWTLKALRKNRNLTLKEISDMLGVSEKVLQNMKRIVQKFQLNLLVS